MKQTIEIEVPDGKKAVWNNGRIEFVDVEVIELLENSKNPEEDLMAMIASEVNAGDGDHILDYLYSQYMNMPENTHIESVAKLKLFLAYLNKGHRFDLISEDGFLYYPYVKFYLKSKLPKGDTAIGQFKYKGNIYALVGGNMYSSSGAGLAFFNSNDGVGYSGSSCSFFACKNVKTAQFVATAFAKLLFDVNFGSLIDYEWL